MQAIPPATKAAGILAQKLMKLLVRNLATATTEEKLRSLFEEHGTVQSCNLVLDQKTAKSKGFGFVEMPKVGEAKAAMKILNGYKLAGNFIRVKKAESKTPATDENPAEAANVQHSEKSAPDVYGKIKKSDD